jgi:HAD superfamily hydrolase (TIGR01549 family)
MSKIDTILFDFDGTLANTLPLIFHTFKIIFQEFRNRDITPEEIMEYFGPTEAGILKIMFGNESDPVLKRYFELYEKYHPEYKHKNEEMIELLEFLEGKKVKMGIVTGKGKETLEMSLNILGMKPFFEVTIDGDDTRLPKPDPEGVFMALKRLGSVPEKTLFVGDSDADVGAGKSAGVYMTVGVNWLSDYMKFSLKPDRFITSVSEFKDLVVNLLN